MATISTTITQPIALSTTGSYASPLTITNTGAVEIISLANSNAVTGPSYQAWTVANAGTIEGNGSSDNAIDLEDGGSVSNSGTAALIAAYIVGVGIGGAAGTVSNTGTISAGLGIDLESGSVANTGTAALISAGVYGVYIFGGGTVSNAGTISGGRDAVKFSSGNYTARVIVDPGAVFVGNVAGGGSNTLELASAASTGTISGLGTQFQNFGTLVTDPGANWVLAGNETITSKITFSGDGTINNSGTITGGGTLVIDPSTFTNSGYSSDQVALAGGSTLFNTNTGTLKVAGTAVYGYGAAATVSNAGTIEGTGTSGLGVYLKAGGSVANTGGAALISGGSQGVGITGGSGTVSNAGTIRSTAASGFGFGVILFDGGSVSNTGSAALISGAAEGISAQAAGTVGNTGTIEGTGIAGVGVSLLAGGSVVNSGTAALISGGSEGVLSAGTPGDATVTNAGTITGTGTHGIGVDLQAGGSVGNTGTAALISGAFMGISAPSAAGTVTNLGTVDATGTAGMGVDLAQGGSLANSGSAALITGDYGVAFYFGPGTITNTGTIAATATAGPGFGPSGFGVYLGKGGTVINAGTIAAGSVSEDAVVFHGNYTDRVIVDPGAKFVGNVVGGGSNSTLELASAAATGTISGIGTKYQNFGTVTVDSGASWVLAGNVSGVTLVDNGSLTTTGSVASTVTLNGGAYLGNAGAIYAGARGVYGTGGAVSLNNTGTVGSVSVGVILREGGSIANSATAALIFGYAAAIKVQNAPGTVSNVGTLDGTGASGIGLYLSGGGSVANTGTIEATGGVNASGVELVLHGGTVANSGTAAVIAGGGYGVAIFNVAGTVSNAGTISGGVDAVKFFGAFTDRMIVDPGATFVGHVVGGGASNTLELASAATTGTLSGLGTQYQNFATIIVDAGADWVLAGNNTIASGVTFTDSGMLTNTGTLSGGGTLVIDPSTFTNSGYSSLQVRLADGSTLVNTDIGTIKVAGTAVYGYGAAATVDNAGTIEATGTSGTGVVLFDGGSVANIGTTALIQGTTEGVYVKGAAGTVSNAGSIVAAANIGVELQGGGSIANIGTAALIHGSADGVYVTGGAGTVDNSGTVTADIRGITLDGGGSVANTGTAALITGYQYAVTFGGPGTLSNSGTIASRNDAVRLKNGGSVANIGPAALIQGGLGVHKPIGIYIAGAAGKVANAGTIDGGYFGVFATAGGSVDNSGTAALIQGRYEGIYVKGAAGTVSNAGTMSGGTDAVIFAGAYTDRVIVDPGAVFVGNVVGGSGSNTLELASGATTGTVSGLGTKYQNFGSVVVDLGATWALGGANTASVQVSSGATLEVLAGAGLAGVVDFVGATGTLKLDGSLASDPTPALAASIHGFGPGEVIDLSAVAFDGSGSVGIDNSDNVLQVTEHGVTDDVQLDPGANFVGAAFAATSDGGSGTDITVTMAATTPPVTPAGTTADMIVQDTQSGVQNGVIRLYDLGDNTALASYVIGQVGLDWQLLGVGGFDVPETSDFILRQGATNDLEVFDVANSQVSAAGPLGNIGAEWQVLGFGGFAGNPAESDMLMRDSGNGAIDVFDIQGNRVVAAGPVGNIGAEWQVLGIGDFSSNPGESDMLMRDSATNDIDYFDIDNNEIVAAGPVGNIGQEWQVLGIGDFSGNPGESDMLMRDTATNNIDFFDIEHNQIVAAGPTGNIGAEWQVVGFGDVSGNPGESDMLMRDSGNGAVDVFDIQRNQIVAAGPLTTIGVQSQIFGVGAIQPGS